MTVVPDTPGRRLLMLAALVALGLGAVFMGYLLGEQQSGLDRNYLALLEQQKRAGDVEIEALKKQLIDADLVRAVDRQAAATLQENIKTLRDDIGGLEEEVTELSETFEIARVVSEIFLESVLVVLFRVDCRDSDIKAVTRIVAPSAL